MFRTKDHDDTDHPVFNEVFDTKLISAYSIIEIEMWDSDEGFSSNDPMSKWSGYAQHYLSRDSLVGSETDSNGKLRNSLNIFTKTLIKTDGK